MVYFSRVAYPHRRIRCLRTMGAPEPSGASLGIGEILYQLQMNLFQGGGTDLEQARTRYDCILFIAKVVECHLQVPPIPRIDDAYGIRHP